MTDTLPPQPAMVSMGEIPEMLRTFAKKNMKRYPGWTIVPHMDDQEIMRVGGWDTVVGTLPQKKVVDKFYKVFIASGMCALFVPDSK